MNFAPAKFADFGFSRFGFIVRTILHRLTDKHNIITGDVNALLPDYYRRE